MKLTRFRVTNFRSVKDSEWVDADGVTALIGVNESGKTNLLLPLWKLNPVGDGEIQPTSDFPKTMFGEIRGDPGGYSFIEAEFDTGAAATDIAQTGHVTPEVAAVVRVTRRYDGKYIVKFPKYKKVTTVEREWLVNELDGCAARREVTEIGERVTRNMCEGLLRASHGLSANGGDNRYRPSQEIHDVGRLIPSEYKTTSKIVPCLSGITHTHYM